MLIVTHSYSFHLFLREQRIIVLIAYHSIETELTEFAGGGLMHLLFIYLFTCWSNRMSVMLLCYHPTALRTSIGDISVTAICYFWRFFLVHYYIGRPL